MAIYQRIFYSKYLNFSPNINIQKILISYQQRTLCTYNEDKSPKSYDLVVVGGGIVGTASAREVINRHPTLKIAIVEKEPKLAVHQSGHNSGVVHAGIYYKPGSLKAKLCVEGLRLAYKYFDEKSVPYKRCGKLIVATDSSEVKKLDDLYDRGLANNVPDMKMIEKDEICTIEPHCKGLRAIHSPHTGIVDWGLVTQYFGKDFKNAGGDIYFNFNVNGFEENSSNSEYPVVVSSVNKKVVTKYVLTCGGLQSDILAELSGCSQSPRIIPFRGEYLLLNPEKAKLIKGNIYPVPDPSLPFLGVHFTPRMDGSVWLGPNAVLAFKREGYRWSDINISELWDAVKYPGFRKLAMKHLTYGGMEVIKSFVKSIQVKELQKFVSEVTLADVIQGPAGVRAQALDISGNLVDDFVFDMGKGPIGKRVLHCRNAPSPGATSSLAIAKMIVDKIEKEFQML